MRYIHTGTLKGNLMDIFKKINNALAGRKTEIGIIALAALETATELGVTVHPVMWVIVYAWTGVGGIRRIEKWVKSFKK